MELSECTGGLDLSAQPIGIARLVGQYDGAFAQVAWRIGPAVTSMAEKSLDEGSTADF